MLIIKTKSHKEVYRIQQSDIHNGVCTIPDGYNCISPHVSEQCSGLKEIRIPDSVTKIGCFAFFKQQYLTDITIPDGVTEIDISLFSNCKGLTQVKLPRNLIQINSNAFYNCKSLKHIKIPDGTIRIGEHAFFGCENLTKLNLPDSITQIEEYTFVQCFNLEEITLSSSLTCISQGAFAWCKSLTQITIPDGVTHIEADAFKECSDLESIILPDSMTYIGDDAFRECTSLTHIIIDTANRQSFERIQSLLPETIRHRVITAKNFLNQVGVESGPKRDNAIDLLLKGRTPDNVVNHDLYQYWLKFKTQVLHLKGFGHCKITTLKNLCLFALPLYVDTNNKDKPANYDALMYQQHTPKNPDEIKTAFNHWAQKKIHSTTQASSSSAAVM